MAGYVELYFNPLTLSHRGLTLHSDDTEVNSVKLLYTLVTDGHFVVTHLGLHYLVHWGYLACPLAPLGNSNTHCDHGKPQRSATNRSILAITVKQKDTLKIQQTQSY